MATLKRYQENNEEAENVLGFSKSARGYNTKEVDEFISQMKKNNANAIKNYENKITDLKNTIEMLECENENLKSTLKHKEVNEKNAIAAADDLRGKLKQLKSEMLEIDTLKVQKESADLTVSKLQREKEAAEKELKMALVDKKTLKDKLESVKKELSETKTLMNNNAQQTSDIRVQQTLNDDENDASSAAKAVEELERVVGAYTIHLRKTQQIVDSLNEQLKKANDIF